ncbi:MAG: cysteine--tRNA ligase, partial [Flavobacteriales bacterium]|nr:cysteine--tRNA ligase [Flavobacteriales bacterium]
MSRKIQIYNTLTRKKEIFNPIVENHVGMYVCGPTVYGDPHLGHARPSITFDVVFRYLKHSDYKVRYVRNITDAGHLENDADEGEDKIAKKARLEQLEPMEIVQFYTISYHKAMDALNCLPPSIEPRATGHIIEQIEMVQKILKNGFAYEVNSSVYLDVNKYNESYPYGTLSGRNIEDTLEGTRALDGQSEKKSSVDFAIWKKANPEHIMRWDSPWGEGFPGWHMECSAMSEKYLGKTFDIHGGGMDLVFPHHEAEIAQSNACNNCNPVNYWMHNNMITVDGKKMGKSLGNFINLEEFFNGTHAKLDRAYSPMTIRFFILQAQYRSTVDFGNEALQAAEKGFTKLMNAMETLENLKNSDSSTYDINELEKNCYAAMDDDFNTPILIAHLFDGVRIINSVKDGKESLTASDLSKMKKLFSDFVTDILGLTSAKESGGNDLTEEVMELVLKLRGNAKKNKD